LSFGKLEAPQALASTPAETLNQTELGMLDRKRSAHLQKQQRNL